MAHTSSLPSVAIAGATGHLGCRIAAAFLEPTVRARFAQIVLLMRKPVADLGKLLGVSDATGATVRIYDETSIKASIDDIDVMICTIGVKGDAFRQKLIKAMSETKVRLYFPSEFGIDRSTINFAHPEWDHKEKHYQFARSALPHARVCRVYNALLLEDSIGPWFGFDTKNARYEVVGSPETPLTFTSLFDVGRAVAQLSLLPPEKVPEIVRLAGDTKTPVQMAKIMEKAGSAPIAVTGRDLQASKDAALASNDDDPAEYLRFMMGEGNLNHGDSLSGKNDNALVNPNEQNWKWKTLADLAQETAGRPWASLPWPPVSKH